MQSPYSSPYPVNPGQFAAPGVQTAVQYQPPMQAPIPQQGFNQPVQQQQPATTEAFAAFLTGETLCCHACGQSTDCGHAFAGFDNNDSDTESEPDDNDNSPSSQAFWAPIDQYT